MVSYVPISSQTFTQISKASSEDREIQAVAAVIIEGWPDNRSDLSTVVQQYFNYRDELSFQNGVVFKGERVVEPKAERHNIMVKLHSSHCGIQNSLRRAREAVFWPNMNRDVKEFINKWEICACYNDEQQKELLKSHSLPSRPWEKVAVDLFDFEGKDFLITTDYYSDFFEVDRLHDKTSKTVIRKLKQQFARHGIPVQVMSDNGPPFGSKAFTTFARTFEFEHCTSSPRCPQSKGKIENSVKVAKRIMIKSRKAGTAPYLALLDWRNTPTEHMESSPVQRLYS
ncbi:uncharacterized protein LOC124284493 [Haliotis rubra]|uniref:uncharacterized protein LOC124284493 n=1 Tax=Haliotis rubra TaxID=36100 RepID=UPI001EE5BC3F|nr:uncharacterized protein LOC124284493 [Haliotis rubra]